MVFNVRQVEPSELSRRDLHCLAFLPYRYTAHQVAMKNVKHWAIPTMAAAAFAATLCAGCSLLASVAALLLVPAYIYAHSRVFDWLVIMRHQPDYADFASVWGSPHRVFVAECNETKELVGLVCLQHQSADVCDLQHIAVKSAHRRMGLGSRLMAHFITEAASSGYKRVTLYSTTVQMPAVTMYKRLGFTVDRIHNNGVYRRIPFLPKPFDYVFMSMQLNK